jgi:acetoacetyl-CoA synthetase
VGAYLDVLERERGLRFADYHALWRWSVDDPDGFWGSIASQLAVQLEGWRGQVLAERTMPGARWFPDASLNYARHALALVDHDIDDEILVSISQTRAPMALSVGELRAAVARARTGLRRLGVGRGDRVAAYLPNVVETVVAFLATASLGAVWSSCAPEFGTRSVVDRFAQIEPTVLITIDGYRYGSRTIDRTMEVAAIRAELPSLRATVVLPYLHADATARIPGSLAWAELTATEEMLEFEPVPFDHPLYVLFSSGTTGLPKAIVHGHGGILLEHQKALALHTDLGPGDRFFWFTTTGWMMWNYLVSGLVVGAGVVLFDGDPGHPDLTTLWRLAADHRVTYLGVSAPYLMACRTAGLTPGRELEPGRLRGIGSTGAPLPADGFRWVYDAVGRELVLGSLSGGTDLCTGFVGPTPLLPVRAGEITCRMLGARVESFDETGRSIVGRQGELVITAPMPSMPVGLWGDPTGEAYRAAYFEDYPGVWRHGDWITITERGSCVITGRSDATLNRGGVRLGTAEFYAVVEALPEIADSLVVHLEDDAGGPGELLLFVALRSGSRLDGALRDRIGRELRAALSPRHVPDQVLDVPSVPRTLSGKKLEIPVKRILSGTPADQAASRGSLADPTALDAFEELARTRRRVGRGPVPPVA